MTPSPSQSTPNKLSNDIKVSFGLFDFRFNSNSLTLTMNAQKCYIQKQIIRNEISKY